MPRRFTDTEKWRDEWWGSLDNDYRIIWLYLIDSCSIAGIWKKDFRGLNFNCNTKIDEVKFLEVFGSRVMDKGNFFFIPKFVRYQNPKGLKSNKPAVLSIIKELELNNLIPIINESLGNDFLIVKGKGKGIGIGKGEGKGEGKGIGTGTTEPPKDDELLLDYDQWTIQITDGNDQYFEQMFIKEAIPQSPNIQFWIHDHRDLLNRYPKMRPPNQQAFRQSCIKHIRENYKKEPNGKLNGNSKQQQTANNIDFVKQHYSKGATGG